MVTENELYLVALSHQPFSPLVLANGVDALPHQIAALYGDIEEFHKCPSPIPHKVGGVLRTGFPVKALIADETGLGKTIISGLFIFSLLLRGLVRNTVILTPKSVTTQWQDELFHKFGIYFKTIEHGDELLGLIDDFAHDKDLRFIVSLDLIKGDAGQELVSSIPEKGLDLVVIDEAHHVITRSDTLRFQIANSLAKKTKSLLLLSATPFRGYYETEYNRVLELLGPNFLYIRRFKDQVRDANGVPLFPKRVSYKVVIDPDPTWYQMYLKIEKHIKSMSLNALTKLVLLKRLSSSLHALYSTLKKTWVSEEDSFNEDTDDVYSIEPDVRESIYEPTKETSRTLQVILDIVSTYIRQNKLTLKEQEFLRLLQFLNREYKVVVFTEYKTTLDRLREVLKDNNIKFTYVYGKMDLKERRQAIQTFWNDKNVKVFLATDAAGEGINLQVAPYQINYDLPWSPFKLEQRFGRIHRYGQRHTTRVYNLAVKGTMDDYILNRVLKKLDNVVKLLGDWVFDYIGEAIEPVDIRKVVVEGLDVITEGSIAKKFEEVRNSAHNPNYNYEYTHKRLELLKGYMKNHLHKNPGEKINVLEVLRLSRLAVQDIYRERKVDIDGYAIAIYKADGHIASLYFLEKKGTIFLDPFTNSYISYNNVEQYLKSYVKGVAEFYGFKDGFIELYGI